MPPETQCCGICNGQSIYRASAFKSLLIFSRRKAGPVPSSRWFRFPGEQNEPLMPNIFSLTDGFRYIKVLIFAEIYVSRKENLAFRMIGLEWLRRKITPRIFTNVMWATSLKWRKTAESEKRFEEKSGKTEQIQVNSLVLKHFRSKTFLGVEMMCSKNTFKSRTVKVPCASPQVHYSWLQCVEALETEPGLEYMPCHLLAVWPWACYTTSLSLFPCL